MRILARLFVILLAISTQAVRIHAAPIVLEGSEALGHDPAFIVPRGLEGRVKFWVNVFSKWGKQQSAFHHRDYPQVVFSVLDFSREAESMSAIALDRFKDRAKKTEEARLMAIFKRLAQGSRAQTAAEQEIVSKMSFIPGGTRKYQDVVKEKLVRSQTGIREKYIEAVKRSGRYLPVLERIFREYDLPVEITRLPFVESSFDYTAYSAVGAAGIWQFMPRTARLYMKVNSAVDERRDPVQATIGAAKYLRNAYESLGTWPLAITSYNHGIYGVSKAVRKMGTKDIVSIIESSGDRAFGFASNNFYPEFLAALEVYDNYHRYFPGLQIEPALAFEQMRLSVSHSVQFITTRLGVSRETLKPLNYALSKAVWDGRMQVPAGYVLKVPVGYGMYASRLQAGEPAQFAEAAKSSSSSVYGGLVYKVRRGDTLISIAKKFNTPVAELMELNDLPTKTIKVGQILTIKRKGGEQRSEKPKASVAAPTKSRDEPAVGYFDYVIRRGDTLSSLGRRYGLTISEIKDFNGLTGDDIRPGDRLRIPRPGGAADGVPAKKPVTKSYAVRKGDSLWSISRKFGVTVDRLKQANRLVRSGIKPGDVIVIP